MKDLGVTDDFWEFMELRRQAALAYVNGDFEPLSQILGKAYPATFFTSAGDVVDGAENVAAHYDKDAEAFDTGNQTELEVLDADASGEIAYWVGYQLATMHMKGRPEPIPMKLRVTEIFRKEDGAWKLVHRHADMPEVKSA